MQNNSKYMICYTGRINIKSTCFTFLQLLFQGLKMWLLFKLSGIFVLFCCFIWGQILNTQVLLFCGSQLLLVNSGDRRRCKRSQFVFPCKVNALPTVLSFQLRDLNIFYNILAKTVSFWALFMPLHLWLIADIAFNMNTDSQ